LMFTAKNVRRASRYVYFQINNAALKLPKKRFLSLF
jgi:hypothetical protein